jgi:hypothetical protein
MTMPTGGYLVSDKGRRAFDGAMSYVNKLSEDFP